MVSPGFAGTLGKAMDAASHANTLVAGCTDASNGEDNGLETAAGEAAFTTGVIAYKVVSASAAGAGSLTGYAGTASAVSTLGLNGLTTAAAGAMGSSATGAAATAVVTSAVGGPVVMGVIIVGGTAALSYGVYKGGQWLWDWASE